jgi:PIN domain nuclease of toxin-antitoxin system
LETHAAIWALDAPGLLGLKGRKLIEDPSNEILVSPVVPWEIAIKANKRKIAPHALVSDFLSVMRRQDFVPI